MNAVADHDDWLGQPYTTPAAPLPFYGPRNALPGIERPYTAGEWEMIASARQRRICTYSAFIEERGLEAEFKAFEELCHV